MFVIVAAGQVPRDSKGATTGSSLRSLRTYPAPTNLKVLPKGLSGHQVHDVMEQWSGELGVRCGACHIRDSEGVVPAAEPHSRFADDSKPMKRIARIMYTMTVEINRKFIVGADGAPGRPVTCGTCHRGNIRPEPFVSPPDRQQPQERATISR